MDRLGRHPLSGAAAAEGDPPQPRMTNNTEGTISGFRLRAAKERNESLAVSLEFSLRRLRGKETDYCPDLAVFQGGAFEDYLLEISGIKVQGCGRPQRAELERAAGPDHSRTDRGRVVTLPAFPPHAGPLPDQPTQPKQPRRLETHYWQGYYHLASYLYQADSQTPMRHGLLHCELPNLGRAFDLLPSRWRSRSSGGVC